MEILKDSELGPGRLKNTVVTIGNFDGVHVGHRALVLSVCASARQRGAKSVVYTFDPHPLRVLDAQACPPAITDFEEKAELLAALGVDVVVRVDFDREYASAEPDWFARDVLCGCLGAVEVWVGPDFVFGKGRAGNIELLRRTGADCGYEVRTMPRVDEGGERVSSTRVREAVKRTDFEEVARLLGRPFALHGKVVKGMERGRQLGFPTANLEHSDECLPPSGVYAAFAEVDGNTFMAAVNVGNNPTFTPEAPITVEANLLDFEGDLYGRQMKIIFVRCVRGETAFASASELVAQIERDIIEIRRILGDARKVN